MSTPKLDIDFVQEKGGEVLTPFLMGLDLRTGEISVDIDNVGAAGISSPAFLELVNQKNLSSLFRKLLEGETVCVLDGAREYICESQERQKDTLILKVSESASVIPPAKEYKPIDRTMGTVSGEVDMVLDIQKMETQVVVMRDRVSEFLHEVNSPLSSIRMFCDLLDDAKIPPMMTILKQKVQEFGDMYEWMNGENITARGDADDAVLSKMKEAQSQLGIIEGVMKKKLKIISKTMNVVQKTVTLEEVGKCTQDEGISEYVQKIFSRLPDQLIRIEEMQSTLGVLNPNFGKKDLKRTIFSTDYLKEGLRAIPKNLHRPEEILVIDGEEIDIEADKYRLLQVLVVVVKNAFSFLKEDVPGGVRVSISDSAQAVRLIISDSGPGIREQDRDVIFEKSGQGAQEGRKKEKHSGLGLQIAKKIVEAHDGTITVGDSLEGGAQFEIVIPKPAKE